MAAGGSRRLGQPKQLLSIESDILINHMIRTIKKGGIDDLYVILGHAYHHVEDKIADRQIRIVENPSWEEGISSSIKAGLKTLDPAIDAVIFFVVDQPNLKSALVEKFISKYKKANPGILTTRVGSQLCHPVLFTHEYFSDLRELHGDRGGKQLFSTYEIDYFDWEDESLLVDIDTQADYDKFQESMG